MSDAVESRAPRTYPLPKNVVAEAEQARRWQQAYGAPMAGTARWVSAFLASGGSVTSEIVGVLASMMPPRPELERTTDPSYPSPKRIEWSLYGGDSFSRWAQKIVDGVRRDEQNVLTASLETLEYDPKQTYLGLTYRSDPSLVRALVRIKVTDATKWDEWSPADQAWRPIDPSDVVQYEALMLDRDLVATTAAALAESDGLLLMFREPAARLGFTPLLAAADVADNVPPGAHYYAVVDPTDTTAVMNLISISPGPIVKVRDGGKWTDGSKVLAQLTSIAPPPLVELSPSMLEMVMAQIDGTVADAETNPDYVESLGNEKDIETHQQVQEQQQAADFARKRQQTKTLTASVQSLQRERDHRLVEIEREIHDIRARDALAREEFDSQMNAIRAAAAVDQDELTRIQTDEQTRQAAVREALDDAQKLYQAEGRRYQRLIMQSALEASAYVSQRLSVLSVVASATPVSAKPTRSANVQAESKKYWIADRGPVRIRWGCERGEAS